MKEINKICSIELFLNKDVTIKQNEAIALSLDCQSCIKFDRTVDFLLTAKASCQKSGHDFSGSLLDIKYREQPAEPIKGLENGAKHVFIEYLVTYLFKPFKELETGRTSSDKVTWGQVHFLLTCPKCKHKTASYTQPNISRPREIECEKCTHLLCIDKIEQPKFKSAD